MIITGFSDNLRLKLVQTGRNTTHTPVADDASLKWRVAHRWYQPQETLLETAQTEHGFLWKITAVYNPPFQLAKNCIIPIIKSRCPEHTIPLTSDVTRRWWRKKLGSRKYRVWRRTGVSCPGLLNTKSRGDADEGVLKLHREEQDL